LRIYIFFLACFAVIGCKSPTPKTPIAQSNPTTSNNTLGVSKAEAIEVCDPSGELQYLRRLKCSDGNSPKFNRSGNVGPRTSSAGVSDQIIFAQMDPKHILAEGEGDYHIIDLYDVQCSTESVELYLDMYHCATPPPTVAPSGFTIQ
jgi:hypothetical protein